MKRLIFILTTVFVFVAGSAFAITYTIEDNWIDWPGYPTSISHDVYGNPVIDKMLVTADDSSNILQSVAIVFTGDTRLTYDTLFLGSALGNWDFMIRDGNSGDTTTAADGLYSVAATYNYTLSTVGRIGTPNGIAMSDLTLLPPAYTATYSANVLTYNVSALGINTDNLFVAYAPYCGNEVIGGAPVPEPATLLLLGSGILGFGLCRRFKK